MYNLHQDCGNHHQLSIGSILQHKNALMGWPGGPADVTRQVKKSDTRRFFTSNAGRHAQLTPVGRIRFGDVSKY